MLVAACQGVRVAAYQGVRIAAYRAGRPYLIPVAALLSLVPARAWSGTTIRNFSTGHRVAQA
eukprot:3452469-Rhodomonas_salina.1